MQVLEFIGNHLFLSALLLSLVLLLLWDIIYGMAGGATLLSPAELTMVLNRQQAALLDLRSVQDYSTGHIISARNIPVSELPAQGRDLDEHKTNALILYCNNGVVSGKQGRILKSRGFEQVYVLRGGMQEWRNANFPLARAEDRKDSPRVQS